jgi:hypothetical protein
MECGFLLAVGLQEREGLKARPQASSSPSPLCFLGIPNSSYMVTIELTCADAVNVCNDLTDPIRTIPSLEAFKVVVRHDYSPYQICRYQRYGLTWTIWDQFKTPEPDTISSFVRYPGAPFCP